MSLMPFCAFPHPDNATERFVNDFINLKDFFAMGYGFEEQLNDALRVLLDSHDVEKTQEMVEACKGRPQVNSISFY